MLCKGAVCNMQLRGAAGQGCHAAHTCRRSRAVGKPQYRRRSRRPGRNSAASSMSGRDVAPTTITPAQDLRLRKLSPLCNACMGTKDSVRLSFPTEENLLAGVPICPQPI